MKITNKQKMLSEQKPHYGFRKLSVGLASMLLSTTLFLGANTSKPVHADTVDDSDDSNLEANISDSDDLARPTTQVGDNSASSVQNSSQTASAQPQTQVVSEQANHASASANSGQASTVNSNANTANSGNASSVVSASANNSANTSSYNSQSTGVVNAQANIASPQTSQGSVVSQAANSASANQAGNVQTYQSNYNAQNPANYDVASANIQLPKKAKKSNFKLNLAKGISKTSAKLSKKVINPVGETTAQNVNNLSNETETASEDVKRKRFANKEANKQTADYQILALNNDNSDKNDLDLSDNADTNDNSTSSADLNSAVHNYALKLANAPVNDINPSLFMTNLVATDGDDQGSDDSANDQSEGNDDSGHNYWSTEIPKEAPEGTKYVIYAKNGPDFKYINPVTGQAFSKSDIWGTATERVFVYEAKSPADENLDLTSLTTDSAIKSFASAHGWSKLSEEGTTVWFSRILYLDAQGNIIGKSGYDGVYNKNGDQETNDPMSYTIGGIRIGDIIDVQAEKDNGNRIAKNSLQAVKAWEAHPGDQTRSFLMLLVPAEQTCKIRYYDNFSKQYLDTTDTVKGSTDQNIEYDYAPRVNQYKKQGYIVEDNPFEDGTGPHKFGDDKEITITLNHGHKDIKPSDPHNPKTGKDETVTKNITRTINYHTPDGVETPHSAINTVHYIRQGQEDLVTGKIDWFKDWSSANPNWPQVTSPQLNNLTPDKASVPSQKVGVNDDNQTVDVTYYAPNENKNVTRTIHYNVPGGTAPEDKKQPTTLTRTIKHNPDGTTSTGDWTGPDYPGVDNPVIPGYHTENSRVPSEKPTDHDTTITVNYVPNGHLIPTKQDGTPIPNVDHPQYPTDPQNPTKVKPTTTPNIPGYTTPDNQVVPKDPSKDQNVPYQPNGKIVPVDENNVPIPNAKQPQYETDPNNPSRVKPNEPVPDVPGYTPTQTTVTPSDPTKDTPVIYKKNDTKLGKIIPVDESGKPIPDAPQPQYQPDPNDPSKAKPDQPVPNVPGYLPKLKTVTPTDPTKDTNVPYVKIGKIVPVDNDGKPIPDAPQPQYQYDPNDPTKVKPDEPVPTIPGYIPAVKTVTPTDPAKDTNVPYKKIGKIIPVDKDGNPIPNAKQPQYQPDPNDPTKVKPNEPVPDVPGYTPKQTTVTPTDPTVDTKVPYDVNPNTQYRDAEVIVDYKYGNGPHSGQKAHDDVHLTNLRQSSTNGTDWTPGPDSIDRTSITIQPIKGYEGKYIGYSSALKDGKMTYYLHVRYTESERQQVGFTVRYLDQDTPDANGKPTVLNTRLAQGKVGDDVYNPQADIKSYTDKGYELVKNDVPTGKYTADENGKTYDVVLKHGITKTTGDIPNPSPNPEVHGKMTKGLTKKVPVTTKYTYKTIDGKTAHPDENQTITYNAPGEIDMVTGKVTKTGPFKTTDQIKTDIPNIPGYAGKLAKTDGNIDDPDVKSITQHVVYTANDVGYKLRFIDQTDNNKVLTTENFNGHVDDPAYDPTDEINSYKEKGYELVKNNAPTGKLTADENGKTYDVVLKHGITKTTGDIPNPSPNPKVHGKMTQGLTKKVPVTTKYTYKTIDGKTAHPDENQTLTYNAPGEIDMVTGKVIKTGPFKTTDQIKTDIPNIPGYAGKLAKTDGNIDDPDVKSITQHVVYTANDVGYKLRFIDQTDNNKVLTTENFNGHVDDPAYDPTDEINSYKEKGYELVKNNAPTGKLTTAEKDKTYDIILKHGIHKTIGDIPNPSPNPKVHGKMTQGLTKKVPVTTKYTYKTIDGKTAHPDENQTITYNAPGEIDMVTGKVTKTGPFKTTDQIKTDIPDISGYTGKLVKTDGDINNPDTKSITQHVVYNANAVKYNVHFIDQTDNNKVLADKLINGHTDDPTYDPADDINSYQAKGYELVSNNVPTGRMTPQDDGQTFNVVLKHGTKKITGDQPNPSPNPDVHGKMTKGLTKHIPVTTKYSYDKIGGKEALPDKTQDITFNADGEVDLVTGAVKRISPFRTTDTVEDNIPIIQGFTGKLAKVDGDLSNPDTTKVTRYVVYNKNEAKTHTNHIEFVDQTTGKSVITKEFSGKDGDKTPYTTTPDINKLTKKGYKVINDETKGKPITFGNKDQIFHVYLGHQINDVSRSKTVVRRIRYVVPNGSTAPKTVYQTLVFTDHGKKDMVTGKTEWDSAKNPQTKHLALVKSPAVDGATPDKKQVNAKDITLNASNWNDPFDEDIVVTYRANKDDNVHGKADNSQHITKLDKQKLAPVLQKAEKARRHTLQKGRSLGNGTGHGRTQNSGNQQTASNAHVPSASRTVQAATLPAATKQAVQKAEANKTNALPQTGEDRANALSLIAVGSLLVAFSAIGMYESKRKKA